MICQIDLLFPQEISTVERSVSPFFFCPFLERPPGFDRVRNAEIGNKDFELDVLEEAYTTEHWLVRIYKVSRRYTEKATLMFVDWFQCLKIGRIKKKIGRIFLIWDISNVRKVLKTQNVTIFILDCCSRVVTLVCSHFGCGYSDIFPVGAVLELFL